MLLLFLENKNLFHSINITLILFNGYSKIWKREEFSCT